MKRAQMEIVGLSHEKHLQIGAIRSLARSFELSVRKEHFSLCRLQIYVMKNAHSFGTTDIAFFAAFSLMASGVAATLFLDELFVLTKIVSGLSNAFRHAFDSVGLLGGQEELKQLMKYEEICSTRMELTSVTNTNIICAVCTSFVLNSMQIVLPDYYRSFEPERHATGMNGATYLKLGSQDIPNCGVNVWIEQLALEASLEEEKAEIFFKLTQLHVLLFKSSPEVLDISDQTKIENLVSASSCLCDASLSHFKFSLCLAILEEAEQDGSLPGCIGISTSNGPLINLPVNSTLETLSDRPSVSERPRTQSTSWLLAHLTLSDVYIVGCPMKNILSRKHDSHELEITFSIAGQLKTITCQSQGGCIFLETSAVVILIQIFDSYFNWIKYLYSAPQSSEETVDKHGDDMASTNINPSPHTLDFHKINWNLLETFTMDISQLCLALLASDRTGRIDELLLEMDTHLDLRLGNVTRQSSLVISKLSILSLTLSNKMEDQNLEIQSPHLSSNISIATCANNDPLASVDHEDMMLWNESSSRHSILNNGYSSHDLVDSDDQISCSNPQNYILKELSIFLMVEWSDKRDIMESLCLNETWVGNGSISGLEMTISLRELQRALFKVKYHKMRWKSHQQYFSLHSLYAKSDSGEPLRLNCRARSDFLDISGSDDSAWSLWKVSYATVIKTFIDGLWELTGNPGSPVKLKVLDNPSPSRTYFNDHELCCASQVLYWQNQKLCFTERMPIKIARSGFLLVLQEVKRSPIVPQTIQVTRKVPFFQVADARGETHGSFIYFRCFSNKEREHPILELVLSIFYRSVTVAGVPNDVPVHLYARVDKVENNLGLGILCQFNSKDNVSVTAQKSLTLTKESTSRILGSSHGASTPEYFSDSFATSTGRTSRLENLCIIITSVSNNTCCSPLSDSKSFPGPFIVVEVSQSPEDGLSVIISPSLKIHNETNFSMELRFQRPEEKETELASLNLNAGDSIDDTMVAFSAINLSGGSKRALVSLGIGNFLFSFRPSYTDIMDNKKVSSVEWSEDLKGGKPVHLSGVFDKLSYQVRKAFSAEAVKSSLSTVNCALKFENNGVGNVYFLIQTIEREVSVVHTDSSGPAPSGSPIALRKLKEIFLLPTVHVANMLHTDIYVNLTDKELFDHADPHVSVGDDNIGCQTTIPSGSSANLYANPSTLYFVITLTSFGSRCKTVNSSDWVRKLQKQKSNVRHLDIELDFGNGKYFASLRLSRGDRGMLQIDLCRDQVERQGFEAYGESPFFLPQNSTRSWLMKSPKVCLKLSEEGALEAQLDLDAISGLTEIDLLVEEKPGFNTMMRLGVSVSPSTSKLVSSQIIVIKPRYVISNESEQMINVNQCYLEKGDMERIIAVDSKQKAILRLQTGIKKKRESTILENLLKKHKKAEDDSLLIHFRPQEAGLAWSGPISVASLGRFFLRFKSSVQSSVSGSVNVNMNRTKSCEFAAVHVVEEDSTIVLHFHRPPNIDIPYRIENCLRNSPITVYQKGSDEPEILGSGATINYVWDDLTLPHKLVVQIDVSMNPGDLSNSVIDGEHENSQDVHLLREIHLDKLRGWKPLYKSNQTTALGLRLSLPKSSENQRSNFLDPMLLNSQRNVDSVIRSSSNSEVGMEDQSNCAPVIVTRLQNINIDSTFTGLKKFNKIKVESLSVDQKWIGAPFASMLRKHQSESNDTNANILHISVILLRPSSTVKQVKFLSIVLQNSDVFVLFGSLISCCLDCSGRSALMREATVELGSHFWTSHSGAPIGNYYFDPFLRIHPIRFNGRFLLRINRTFFPGDFDIIFLAPPRSRIESFLLVLSVHSALKCIDGNGLSGTKRYFGDLGKTLKSAGSNVLFAMVTEISDSILRGAKANGWKGMFILRIIFHHWAIDIGQMNGFHQGILQLAMEPSVLGSAFMEGGPDRKIKLDRSPGVDELYIEGYLQAMLDAIYKQEYLRVRVMDNQVILKNLPPNSSLVDEIMERVKGFLVAKALLKGDPSITAHSLRHMRGESEWRLGPIVLTLCEHLFVSFAIRFLRKQAGQAITNVKLKRFATDTKDAVAPASDGEDQKGRFMWKWGIGKFILSAIVAYIDGRLCRSIPNPLARRIVSGFLLSFLDDDDNG
ncbi:hypothetical protein Leryth_020854 [Lithospermum erythrorhizon]|nr:hypothetical protein Leryth_020854 [Lithospermum erythrorhizon]